MPRDAKGRFTTRVVRGRRRLRGGAKVFQRRTRRAKRNVVVNNGPSLIPDTYITKMRYTDNFNSARLNIRTGVQEADVRYAILSGNSIYDPDEGSIVNGYPLGYDEMRHFYKRFYVSSCHIKAQLICAGGQVSSGYRIVILPTNRASIDNIPFDSVVSNPYATQASYVGPAFGKSIITKSCRMSTASMSGRKAPVNENDYHGETSKVLEGDGDPKRQWFFIVAMQAIKGPWDPNDEQPQLSVELTYNVMFYDRRQQVQDPLLSLTPLDEEKIDDGPTGGGPPTEF